MAQVANISPEDSIQQNLDGWCLEVGSAYEKYSVKSAKKFIEYIGREPVVDLGSGDGAGTRVFVENGNPTIAVDINPTKLEKIKGAELVNEDFLTFLNKPVDNIFMHHSLEHFVNYQEVLDRIAEYLKGYCYIAVPRGDHLHSVHHVAFESVEEIIPPGLEVVESGESDDSEWPEFWVIARKR